MNFRLAQLRKSHGLTQQELGDILSVSYQTISKWENGISYPDMTLLPQISQYFGVSVDALLGLQPLEEAYVPSNSGKEEYWKNRLSYLQRTRKILWNDDYMKFLVRDVWKITEPVTVLDCGCGYGFMGMLLMPLLPEGSSYVGLDFSKIMIETAESIFKEQGINARFIVSDVMEYQAPTQYDMVISQALLRHVDNAYSFLEKMITFLKPDGLFISMECNREFEEDGLFIKGLEYDKLCQHDGLVKLWKTELDKQNRDYSIAMKMPHYLKGIGLKNIACRMNDKVTFLEPEQSDYAEKLECIAKADHWSNEKSEQETEADISYFMNHGMNRKEAEDYCRKQNGIVIYLKKHAGDVALTKANGYMISYGWK